MFQPPSRARVLRVRDRLRAVYGVPQMRPHGHPISELILTVLSQSTNDRNRDVAYLRMRARFPTWEAVRDAPLGELEDAIRPGGISRIKSARIQEILREISTRRPPVDTTHEPGEPSLDWLPLAPLAQAREYLCSLPGVGRKTAACVLLFAYGLRDVPVDTHVSRVAARLGLLPAKAPTRELHDRMLALTPRGQELELHVNLLRHGRRTCHARAPACDRCALARMCPSAAIFLAASGTGARAVARKAGVQPRGRGARARAQPRGSTAKAITA